MNAAWADWVAVGLVVAGAAAWLAWRMRRYLRRLREDAHKRSGACAAGCEGCPFSKNCGSKTR